MPIDPHTSAVPFFAVIVSLIAVPLILFSSRLPNLREFWTLAASVIKFLLVFSLVPNALNNHVEEFTFFKISPNISLSLRADAFGVYFALVASGLWILTSLYSIGYVRGLKEHKQTRYFASFAVCLSSTIGVAFAANLLTFIVFYEMLTIATYPLVIHKETPEAIRAGRKYLVYTISAGILLLAAIAWTYNLTGTLDFESGGLFNSVHLSSETVRLLFLLFMAGVGVKAGIMPLHSWLPTAMAAPTPVSALLHAVAVVKSGVFGVVRVVGFIFGPDMMKDYGLNNILFVLAGCTIIIASLLALREDNLKRRLAYSTIGHLSYIVLGVALLSPDGVTGGVMHLAAHATMKITLFFCAGAIYVNLHKENVSELNGIAKVMPWTMAAFSIGTIGLAGIPPVNGFISKFYIGAGAIDSHYYFALVILLVSGLLNAAYLFPIIVRAYFKESNNLIVKGETNLFMVVPLVITAILSIVFGLAPNLWLRLFDFATTVAKNILGGIY